MLLDIHRAVLSLAHLPAAQSWVTHSPMMRSMVGRFIAGNSVDDAIGTALALQQRGVDSALDLLGENVTSVDEARQAADAYIGVLAATAAHGLRSPYISVKLTALGLDISQSLASDNLHRILQAAVAMSKSYPVPPGLGARGPEADGGGVPDVPFQGDGWGEVSETPPPYEGGGWGEVQTPFVRVDMEGSTYTEATLQIVKRARAEFDNVGIVLQSYLYRTDVDVAEMIERGIPVRLVKGAYAEPASVAHPRKADVDAAYTRQLTRLLESTSPRSSTPGGQLGATSPRGESYPNIAVATHDPAMIHLAKRIIREQQLPNNQVEFQLLLGVRSDLRDDLVAEGYRVRSYIPFGSQWYPYFVRRLAERPANLLFVLKNLGK